MDAPERPALSLHMAVLKNDRRAIAQWYASSKEEWYDDSSPASRGRKSWAWDAKGDTNLHYAARSGDVATVKELLSLKESVFVRNSNLEIPLVVAARAGHIEVVYHLLGNKVSKRTALMALTNASKMEIIDRVLEIYDEPRGDILNNALCIAVEENALVAVDLLLKSGANPNTLNAYGTPVLTLATTTGYENITKVLLQAGANVNIRSRQDESVVHAVARSGHSSTLSLLIELGVDVNQTDQQNRTPLFYAVENRNSDLVGLLLKQKANVNHADKRLWTPLHLAASLGKSLTVMQLLCHGATPNALNEDGNKPWEIARNKPLKAILHKACFSKPVKLNQ